MNLNVIKVNKDLEAATAKIAELELQLETKDKAVKETMEQAKFVSEGFATEKAELQKQIDNSKAEQEAAIVKVQTEYQSKIDALTKTVEKADQSSGEKAAHLVASMGVPIGTIKETLSSGLTPTQALSKLESMPAGNERTEFYNKNKALILQASNS